MATPSQTAAELTAEIQQLKSVLLATQEQLDAVLATVRTQDEEIKDLRVSLSLHLSDAAPAPEEEDMLLGGPAPAKSIVPLKLVEEKY